MKLQDFHVEIADWANADQQAAVRELRREVLVLEQGLIEACEQDGLDAACWHVLAHDASGQVIGCARLHAGREVGRMAVRAAWRGHGVGTALLHALIERARALGTDEVTLITPVAALAFCQRAGFTASGAEFVDAGMGRQAMRAPVTVPPARVAPVRDHVALAAGNRGEVAAARLQLLVDTRHQLLIYLPTLEDDLFSSAAELAALRRIASSGRAASIQILLHDPAAAAASDHPLIPLAQRLPTTFQIRNPLEETDLAYAGAYLLTDADGYLYLPQASRPAGRAARADRAAQIPLRQHFRTVWERAERATILNILDL